jgi:hypothetical protein
MKPSPEFLQHHAVEAPAVNVRTFRQGWRVHSRLDALRRDGRLTAGQWQAAVEYREAWESARLEAAATMRLIRGGGGGVGDGGHARLLAGIAIVARLRAVESAIGRWRADLCRACIVHDLPWVALGRHLHCDRETARDWTVAAIRTLARAWSAPQRRQRLQMHAHAGQRPGAV